MNNLHHLSFSRSILEPHLHSSTPLGHMKHRLGYLLQQKYHLNLTPRPPHYISIGSQSNVHICLRFFLSRRAGIDQQGSPSKLPAPFDAYISLQGKIHNRYLVQGFHIFQQGIPQQPNAQPRIQWLKYHQLAFPSFLKLLLLSHLPAHARINNHLLHFLIEQSRLLLFFFIPQTLHCTQTKASRDKENGELRIQNSTIIQQRE